MNQPPPTQESRLHYVERQVEKLESGQADLNQKMTAMTTTMQALNQTLESFKGDFHKNISELTNTVINASTTNQLSNDLIIAALGIKRGARESETADSLNEDLRFLRGFRNTTDNGKKVAFASLIVTIVGAALAMFWTGFKSGQSN